MPEAAGGAALAGCVIAVTADRRFKELAAALERRGTVEHAPALEVVPHLDDESLVDRTREIIANPPDAVVATTGIGFRGWIEAADAAGLAEDLLDVFADARLIARGPKARGAIEAAGLTADWVAQSETTAEIQDFLPRGAVVPRERLQALLPGGSSDGHAVETAIARLRECCGSKEIVRTVVKRGYALAVAPEGAA